MSLSRIAIGTDYSGGTDFLSAETGFDYRGVRARVRGVRARVQ
jgi:hypothetical protein